MAKVINMPKMGEAMEEGQIVSLDVRRRTDCRKGEPLFEIMTDKVDHGISVSESGTLLKDFGRMQ